MMTIVDMVRYTKDLFVVTNWRYLRWQIRWTGLWCDSWRYVGLLCCWCLKLGSSAAGAVLLSISISDIISLKQYRPALVTRWFSSTSSTAAALTSLLVPDRNQTRILWSRQPQNLQDFHHVVWALPLIPPPWREGDWLKSEGGECNQYHYWPIWVRRWSFGKKEIFLQI